MGTRLTAVTNVQNLTTTLPLVVGGSRTSPTEVLLRVPGDSPRRLVSGTVRTVSPRVKNCEVTIYKGGFEPRLYFFLNHSWQRWNRRRTSRQLHRRTFGPRNGPCPSEPDAGPLRGRRPRVIWSRPVLSRTGLEGASILTWGKYESDSSSHYSTVFFTYFHKVRSGLRRRGAKTLPSCRGYTLDPSVRLYVPLRKGCFLRGYS